MAEFVHRQHPGRKTALPVAQPGGAHAPLTAPAQRAQGAQRLVRGVHQLTSTPVTLQKQAAAPVLRAAALDREETAHLSAQRQIVTAQLASMPAALTAAPPIPTAQAAGPAASPRTPADWVSVMQRRAREVEGRSLAPRQYAEFTALQRQVSQTLTAAFRSDRGPAQLRYDTYGEHLATLQRQAICAPVARAVLGSVPPGERLALQRSVDQAAQRLDEQAQETASVVQREVLQRQLAALDTAASQPVWQRIQARRGSGNALPTAIQRHLERGLNHDLSRVRIHDDAEADKLASRVGAVAFTTGPDIFFRSGRFNPNTRSGMELLAHEVTHTVQQAQGRVASGVDPDSALETEARQTGARLAQIGPRFGTHAARTRARPPRRQAGPQRRTAPQPVAPTMSPSIQRLFNPLDQLKKLKERARAAVRQVVRTVKNPAARAATIRALAKKVPAPIRATITKAARKVTATARKVTAAMPGALKQAVKVSATVVRGRLPLVNGLLKAVRKLPVNPAPTFSRVIGTVRQLRTGKGRAQLLQQVRNGLYRTARSALNALPAPARQAVGGIIQQTSRLRSLGIKASRLMSDPAYRQQVLHRMASTPMIKPLAQVGGNLRRFATDKAYRAEQLHRIAQAGKRITLPLQALHQSASHLGQQALVQVVQQSEKAKKWAAEKFASVKKIPQVQMLKKGLDWVRSPEGAGVLAKFGAAVAVGVGIVAVVGTGGAALPLVLAAAGVASGVAGSLAETAVLRARDPQNHGNRKWTTGITPTTMLIDGALGVFLGPAARVVGGGVARVVGSAAKYVGGAGRVAGKVAGAGWTGARDAAGRLLGRGATQAGRSVRTLRQEVGALWQATRQGVQQYNRNIAASVRSGIRSDMLGNAGWRGVARRDVGTLLAGTDTLRKAVNGVARAQVREALSTPLGRALIRQRLGLPGASTRTLRNALFNDLKRNAHEDLLAAAWRSAPHLRRVAYRAAGRNMLQQLRTGLFGGARSLAGKAGMAATAGPRAVLSGIRQKTVAFGRSFRQMGVAPALGHNAGLWAEEMAKFTGLKFSASVKENAASSDQQKRNAAVPRALSTTWSELKNPENAQDAAAQAILGLPVEVMRGKPGGVPALLGYDTLLKSTGGTLGNNTGGDLHEVSAAEGQ